MHNQWESGNPKGFKGVLLISLRWSLDPFLAPIDDFVEAQIDSMDNNSWSECRYATGLGNIPPWDGLIGNNRRNLKQQFRNTSLHNHHETKHGEIHRNLDHLKAVIRHPPRKFMYCKL